MYVSAIDVTRDTQNAVCHVWDFNLTSIYARSAFKSNAIFAMYALQVQQSAVQEQEWLFIRIWMQDFVAHICSNQ